MSRLSGDEAVSREAMLAAQAVDRVAYAIGKVIAAKTIGGSLELRRLDALGKASAAHTLASNMVPDLQEEAKAAWIESNRIAAEEEVADG